MFAGEKQNYLVRGKIESLVLIKQDWLRPGVNFLYRVELKKHDCAKCCSFCTFFPAQ
jgi:hypothetical protein